MAVITNMATLTYRGTVVNSNVTEGELLTTLSATKTAVSSTYAQGEPIAYVISLVNTGTAALTDVTVTDDLGAYEIGGVTRTPLTYADGTLRYFVNGTPEPAPTVEAGPPLTVSGITVPAGGNVALVYAATPNGFAPLAEGSTITNEITVTGRCNACPVTASETVPVREAPLLSIAKAMSPTVVTENGEITYTLTISNSGNEDAVATDDVVVSDTFDPRLGGITVTLNGEVLTEGADYTYDEESGAFATAAGRINVPAASFTQDPVTGEQTVVPGTATLVIVGTVIGCVSPTP